ncbi:MULTISPECIES: hypothetical protein [Burkholderia]|uniref:DUF4148 domain-containing protein n=1 Tax=Burkholderia gladioli TaxID=28095 RepID=A0AB38TS34_BURGA|nr:MULTISPECIES: hypothetical protein [Burkholderia]KAF1063431.1 hypothetical protein LvStA_02071 [Burkholderia gladioli]MBA1366336.1 hypothetical protein [Burkholderia gladioli]MBJ9664872.1 hypothetical protein [Burkholderia gladioli]MBJ9714159.1 hypothetical protein [Burkholderia gladioli]MBU9157561.1 hypothetical protein [Burkholderia gladioli]
MNGRTIGSIGLAAVALCVASLAEAKVQGSGGPIADVVLDHARVERQYRAIEDARRRSGGEMRRNVAQAPAGTPAPALDHPT